MLLALWAAASPAATFVVTKETDDNGPCTLDDCALREAVLAANALPGADVIEIPGGTYQLSLVGPEGEIFSQTGDLDINDDLTIRGDELNPVTIIGDGIDRVIEIISFSGTFEISHVTITGGAAQSSGGGLRASGLSFTLRDSTITGNTTQFGDGGGLFLVAIRSAIIRNCTIVGNSAPLGRGGGIHAGNSDPFDRIDLINNTVSGNSAFSGGGVSVFGGGRFDLVNLTIADNVANVVFGDGFVGDSIGFNRLTVSNTLIANNNCGYISAIPASNGHNMEGPTATCFNPLDGDQMGVPNVMLGPLADNGGPTQTRALLPGSPARDAALDADCPGVDQRGYARPADGDGDFVARCDVGAYEANAAPPVEIPALGGVGLGVLVLLIAGAGCRRLRRRAPCATHC